MTRNEVEKKIVSAVVHLIRRKAFYGHILQQLDKVYLSPENPLKTMGVGRRENEMLIKLYVNIGFVQNIYENEKDPFEKLVSVLEHEVLHLVFNHLTLEFSDKLRGNVAMDLVVNCLIPRVRLGKDGCFVEDYEFPPDKAAAWYYQKLQENDKYKEQCKNGAFGSDGLLSDVMTSHDFWEAAQNDPILGEMIKDMIRKARDLCGHNYGDIPGGLIDELDNLLKTRRPIVPWNKVLRGFVASAMESNLGWTIKRKSKRFGTRPGTRKEDVLNLAVAVDTSGSISDEQLMLFFNEINWIWKNGNVVITILEADAEIQAEYRFSGKFTGEIHGRGGTNLEPVLVKTEKDRYDALIYFTDFYAPKIETRYRIPILWVLTTEWEKSEYPYSWGRHIKIEGKKAVPG